MAYALPPLVKLKQHGEIISRIAYKSRAQHRSSRAFKAVEGARRSFKHLNDVEREAKELLKALRALERQEKRLETETRHASSSTATSSLDSARLQAAHSLLRLILALGEIETRSIAAVTQLSAHLRTPPAPTFAPLIFSQLATCSAIASEAAQALHGAQGEETALIGTYNTIRSTVNSSSARELNLPSPHARRTTQSKHQAQIIKRVSTGGKSQQDLSWLPSKLVRPCVRAAKAEEDVATVQRSEMEIDEPRKMEANGTALPAASAVPFMNDDEDLGEAI